MLSLHHFNNILPPAASNIIHKPIIIKPYQRKGISMNNILDHENWLENKQI